MKYSLYSLLIILTSGLRFLINTYVFMESPEIYARFFLDLTWFLFLLGIVNSLRAEYYITQGKLLGLRNENLIFTTIKFLLVFLLVFLTQNFSYLFLLFFSFDNALLKNFLSENSKTSDLIKVSTYETIIIIVPTILFRNNLNYLLLSLVLAQSITTYIYKLINDFTLFSSSNNNDSYLKTATHLLSLTSKNASLFLDIYLVQIFIPNGVAVFKYVKTLSNIPNLLSTSLTDYFRKHIVNDKFIRFFISFLFTHVLFAIIVFLFFKIDFITDFQIISKIKLYEYIIILYFLLYGFIGFSRVYFLRQKKLNYVIISPILYLGFLLFALFFKIDVKYTHLISQCSTLFLIIPYVISNYNSMRS